VIEMPCPDVMKCRRPTTPSHFKALCNGETGAELRCIHYCKTHEIAKRPIEWLQRIAVIRDTPSWNRRALEQKYAIRE